MNIIIFILTLIPFFVAGQPIVLAGSELKCEKPEASQLELMGLGVNETPVEVPLTKKTSINGRMKDKVIALLVQSVESGSIAEKAGLQPGDLIYRIRGIYFEKHSAKKQLNNILSHSLKRFTMLYFAASGESRSVIIPRPQSICQDHQDLLEKVMSLRTEVETSRLLGSLQLRDFSAWETSILPPSSFAKISDLPAPPSCQSDEHEDYLELCDTLTEDIQGLTAKIPDIQSALEKVKLVYRQDASPLIAEQERIIDEAAKLRNAITLNKWNKDAYGSHEQQLKDIHNHWQEYKASLIQREGKLTNATRAYETVVEEWEKNFKKVKIQFANLQLKKQQIAHQEAQKQKTHERNIASQLRTTLIEKHHAVDLTISAQHMVSLVRNPYAYQAGKVFVEGLYVKHIESKQALIDMAPTLSPIGNIIQMETSRNLALDAGVVRCVVEVLGTTMILQGGMERTIPHVKEVECLP